MRSNLNTIEAAVRHFGFERLTEAQSQLIEAALSGKNTLGIMPTGGGKSACFQIPGIVGKKKTLVISPLIALQDDQVKKLRALGIQAFAFHSGLSDVRRRAAQFYFKTRKGDGASFLYISPEFFSTKEFTELFGTVDFDMLVIDEAHCVSTWGNSFRPDYHRIDEARTQQGIAQVLAFTATVDPRIEKDIDIHLGLGPDVVRVEQSPIRPNLHLSIEDPAKGMKTLQMCVRAKMHRLFSFMQDASPRYNGPIIVYFNSRSGAAKTFEQTKKRKELLRNTGYTPLLYHAALPQEDKDAALNAFKDPNIKPVVFATTAFGMGIDRPDVRRIIHFDTPYTLVDYVQQIGRGGRDGQDSLCTTFHSQDDFMSREISKVGREVPTADFAFHTFGSIVRMYEKLSEEMKPQFTTAKYISKIKHRVEGNDKISDKSGYVQRVIHAVAFLKKVGVLSEAPFSYNPLMRGSVEENTIIELTQMKERMILREKEHLQEFFSDQKPTQERLWEIARRK